ncbi:T9SS type A sorting domain-containing protein [Marivirga tractuosa]|uniref:T9SS type A sorting domain-containing protein n=1 Tax=Marivirga tractuosa TaxID=1006 RepID=UPI0035CF60AF
MKRFLLSILFFVGVVSAGFGQSVGDFQTRQSGNWNDSDTWEEWTGSSWDNTSNIPSSSSGQITILAFDEVTIQLGNAITADQLLVQGDGYLFIEGTLTVAQGADNDLQIETGDPFFGGSDGYVVVNSNGRINNNGEISSPTSNNLTFNDNAVYDHRINGGAIPTAMWNIGSTCLITGSSTVVSNLNQSFYNFEWNNPSQGGGTLVFNGALNDVNGNLIFRNTNGKLIALGENAATSNSCTVDGDFEILNSSSVALSFSDNFIMEVLGNVNINSSAAFFITAVGTGVFNVNGNFTKSNSGNVNFNLPNNISGNGTLNILNDFTASAGTFTKNSSAIGRIDFRGGILQNYANTGSSFTNGINFRISNSTSLDVANYALTGSGTFEIGAGSTLITANADGITTGTTTGAIRVSGTRTYNNGATIEYSGTTAQSLGNGFPASGVNLTINNTGGGVNMSSDVIIESGRTLALTEGTLNIGDGNHLTLNGDVSTTNGGLSGGSLSDLTIGGSGAFGTLGFVGTQELRDFTINRTSSGTVTLGGDLLINGTFDQTAGNLILNGNTFTLSGPYARTAGSLVSDAAASLIINGTGALPSPASFSGDINTITLNRASSTFDVGGSGFTASNINLFSGELTGSAISIADGGNVERQSSGVLTNELTANGTYNLLYNNDVTINSGAELSTDPTAIANLQKDGTGNIDIQTDFTVNGTLTFTNGIFNAGTNTISLNGDLVSNAGSTLADATITFDGTTNLSGSNTPTFGDITVNGTFNPATSLNVNGDITNNGTLNSSAGTLTINATSQLGGTNPVTVNNLTIGGSGAVTANSSQALTINGDIDNSGSFNANGGTVIFGGTTSISGTVPTFANIQVDGTFNAPATLNISGGLTNNGTFNDNDGIINMNGTGIRSIAGTSPFSVYTLNLTGGTINNTNTGGITIENGINVGASTTFDLDGAGSGIMTLRSIEGQDAFIGEIPSGSSISGNINVQRAIYTVGGDSRGYHILGFPVDGLTVSEIQDELSVTGPFSGASPCPTSDCTYSIYSFDETAAGNGVFNDGYTGFPTSGVSQGFAEGEGYYIFTYAGETPVSLEGNGTIFSGDFSTTLSRTGTSDGSGWHMVSNPYPATTDWSQWGNSNVFGSTAYLWNPNTEGYEVYDGGTQQLIPQGQGFFVRAISDGVTLTATEASKVEGSSPTYLRQAPQERFEIILKTPDYDDKTIVSFNENATDNFEPQYDAPRLLNTYETLSTFTADNDTVKVNRLASSEMDSNCGRSVRLNLEQMVAEVDYAIDFNGINTVSSQEIILLDHYLNTETIVTENLVYDFQVTDEPTSTGSNRFELVLSKNGPSQIEVKTTDVCPEQNGLMRLQNTDLYANYIIYQNNEVIATAEGNGVELEVEILNKFLSKEINSFDVKAFVGGCDTVTVGNAQIQVIETLTYDNEVSGSSVCKIADQAPFSVSTQVGVTYHILDNQDTIQSFEGNGSLYEGFLATQNFIDGSNEFVIAAQKDDCESGTLNQALTFDFYMDAIIDEVGNHSICLNETTSIELSANVEMSSYQLYIGDELISDESASSLNLSPKETTTYTLTGVPENGCEVNKINFTVEVNDLAKPGILVSANILESSVEGDTFQWYLDGEILENETGKILVAKQSGDYTVGVTKANCSKVSDSFRFNEEVLSANNALNNALNIYPNPVEDNMFIELNDINSANVTIFTISGKFIDSFEINSSQSEVEMSKYSKGTYLIKFESGKGSVTKRFIKQ